MASCKNRPKVDICIVDDHSQGFQCVDRDEEEYFVNWVRGTHLNCVSPRDMEKFLKGCKEGKIVNVTICHLKILENTLPFFECRDARGNEHAVSTDQADNYACLTDKDYSRIIERCD